MNRAVLLDFDGTITSKDTTKALLIEFLALRPWQILWAAWPLFMMVISSDSFVRQLYKNKAIGVVISGLTDTAMEKPLARFRKKICPLFRPLMKKKIADCLDNNILIVVVTASPTFAIRYCFSDLPVTVIGTEFCERDGVYSGQLNSKNCYGLEKVNRIEVWSKKNSMEIKFLEAWSDHISDFPMLKMAKERYWIGPELLREAVLRSDPCGNFVYQDD